MTEDELFAQICAKHQAELHFDGSAWFLAGTDRLGEWKTSPQQVESLWEAKNAAAEYLELVGRPCPHGQDDPWDCSICSAAEYGGRASWEVCRHGWLLGECPTCYPEKEA